MTLSFPGAQLDRPTVRKLALRPVAAARRFVQTQANAKLRQQGPGMKLSITLLLTLGSAATTCSQVVITPSAPPVVSAGGSVRFTANKLVSWSMAQGSQGTIDQNGTYRAPASVPVQQSDGGCQVLPNNHIFNTRIDSLPVNSNSAAWMDKADSGWIFYSSDFPINYANTATPAQDLTFYYTPHNGGLFLVPAYPDLKVQSGYYASLAAGFDKHVFVISPGDCSLEEIYDLYEAGYSAKCPQCTATSGVEYQSLTYALPDKSGTTNAAGTYIIPLVLRLQEVERALATGGTINHALPVTLKNQYIARSFIWPATANATAPWGIIPYGARFRLRPSFDTSRFSRTGQLLLTQLKQYGLILTDGGSQWEIGVECNRWPPSVLSAFGELKGAVKPTDLEAVDESGLMVSPNSGNTTIGGEVIIATDSSHPDQKAQMPVILRGVAVNFPLDYKYIQVGAPAQRFVAFVSGADNTELTWSMSPPIGSLTHDGLYLPPENVASPEVATVTATSVANPNVAAQMTLTIFPAGPIRIVLGRDTPYTDAAGNIWDASTGYDVGGIFNNGWGGTNSAATDLYRVDLFAPGDMRFDFTVPNGTYQVTAKFASTNAKAPGKFSFDIESQGQVIYPNVDVFAAAGGEYKPVDYTTSSVVTSNQLCYVLRHVTGENMSVAAIQITSSVNAVGAASNDPAPPTDIKVIVQH